MPKQIQKMTSEFLQKNPESLSDRFQQLQKDEETKTEAGKYLADLIEFHSLRTVSVKNTKFDKNLNMDDLDVVPGLKKSREIDYVRFPCLRNMDTGDAIIMGSAVLKEKRNEEE